MSVIPAQGHEEFAELGIMKIRSFARLGAVFFDVNGTFGKQKSNGRLSS
jgi:hypothetical protein